jgi:hypothetical protein
VSVSPSRRQLLQGAVLLPALAACSSPPGRPAASDPDVPLRAAAVDRERTLLAQYDAAASSSPPLAARVAVVREEHARHLAALLGQAPTASPATSPAAAAPTLAQLVAAEHAAATAHAAGAVSASRPLAGLLASLAASEASHPVALA